MDIHSPLGVTLPPLMRDGGEASREAVAALTRHPGFPQAMRAVLSDHVGFFKGNRILNYIGYDRGRLVVAVLALYLHAVRDPADPTSGLTAHRLKSLCVEQDVCSPGRARAMLSLLRLFSYVAPAPAVDRRYRLLVPTELLTASLRQRWAAVFRALALVLPEGEAALAHLERDDFLYAVVRAVIDQYRAGARALHFAPEMKPLLERNAGLMILCSLAIAGESNDTIPPTRPVHISISELARRFSVSRTHVLRVLREGVSEGLMKRAGTDEASITLSPELARAFRYAVATIFLAFAHCIRAALTDLNSRAQSPDS